MRFSQQYILYPNHNQKTDLDKFFGSARFCYNQALYFKKSQYEDYNKNVSYNFLASTFLINLKSENIWLKEVSSTILQQSLKNLDKSYKNFFKYKKGFPKFKNKYSKQSFRIPQTNNHIKALWNDHAIVIPKIGKIKTNFHRKFQDKKISSITVSKNTTGKYFVSILFGEETSPNKIIVNNNEKIIGIDLGIKDFLIDNKGNKVNNPKFFNKALKKLQFLQRIKSKLKKGSNNYNKMKLCIAKLNEYIKNCRLDFLNKQSSRIINENQVIFVEDLNIKNLQQKSNHNMNRLIGDASWSTFLRMLTYKAEFRGKYLIKVNPKNTSKMCSCCKEINKELKLEDREWQCKHCYTNHDRDINAAKNIKLIGQELPEYKALIIESKNDIFDTIKIGSFHF